MYVRVRGGGGEKEIERERERERGGVGRWTDLAGENARGLKFSRVLRVKESGVAR